MGEPEDAAAAELSEDGAAGGAVSVFGSIVPSGGSICNFGEGGGCANRAAN